jgi:hypothetical protein
MYTEKTTVNYVPMPGNGTGGGRGQALGRETMMGCTTIVTSNCNGFIFLFDLV